MPSALRIICLALLLFIAQFACAQPSAKEPDYTAAQILPLLRRHDLAGLTQLVHKPSNVGYKQVKIDLGPNIADNMPFTLLDVDTDHVIFRTADRMPFVFCPVEPPTLEKLSTARTLHELLGLLAPAGKTAPAIRRVALDLPGMLDTLAKDAKSCFIDFRTAYLLHDRLVWICCQLEYSASDNPRSINTPFKASAVTLSISPKLE